MKKQLSEEGKADVVKAKVSRKEKVQKECAARVFSFLETPQGLEGCPVSKIEEFLARAEAAVPGGAG